MILFESTDAELGWLESRLDCQFTSGARGLYALDGGRLVGVMAFDRWAGNSATAFVAVENARALRPLFRRGLRWFFEHRGVLLATIPAHSAEHHRIAAAFGFRKTHRVEDGCGMGDAMIQYELRKEEWTRCR